jgi:hypothetical protein
MDLIVKIIVELFLVLALATKQIKQGRISECAVRYTLLMLIVSQNFSKKLWGKGKDRTQTALERLDRLTKDEGLSAVAHTLSIVYGITDNIINMRVVMGGAPYFRAFLQIFV